MFFPSVCYFLLVAKMAVMMESRYMLPIYAVVLSGVFSVLYVVIHKILCEKICRIVIFFIIVGITASGLKICSWEYLYSDSSELLEKAQQYQNDNAIYIYDMEWKLPGSFFEAANYKSVMFFNMDELERLEEVPYIYDDSLIVSITDRCDSEKILSNILGVFPLLNNFDIIGSYGYTTTYHLYR